LDVDRTPPLIDAADPPGQGNEDPDGWAELAARYNNLSGAEFIRLPEAERAAAIRARQS
jgi:hypothetical protein